MNEKDLVVLYQQGLTIREISERIGKSYESVRKILKQYNVKWRKNYLSDLTAQQIADIVQRFDNGDSIKKIAKWYEFSPPAISRLLKSQGKEPVVVGKKYDILRQTPINTIQKQFLVGTLLGDGCLYKDSKKGNFKLSFSHCKKQEAYFHWKVVLMDPFINNYRENDKELQTATICHQDFNRFGEMFYTKSRLKIVPDNLDIYLTPLALAVWIMDDGNLNAGVNMRIATQGFTYNDNVKLQSYLKSCFGLRSKVMPFNYKGKKYWQLTLNKRNTQLLSDLIRPYILESMMYKIMPESSTTTCQTLLSEDIV